MVTELRKPGIDLVRQVRNAVIAIDLEQRIVLWNSFAETLYQWKAEEALGRNIIELIVPDEARIAAEEIIESLKETGHWDDEFVVRAKDGHTFPVYVDVSAIRGTNGEVIGFVGASTDVTQLKRLNRALQESEERFRSFMNHLPGYAWIKNADGSYVYMNKRLEEVLPKRQDDWVGRTDTDFWPPEIAAQFQINDQRVLRSGQELQAVEPWIREGQVRHSLVSKFPIFDAQGNAIMVGGASIDITEHKRAEQALRENQSHLQAILDYCPAMIFLKDLDGRYLQVNRELERTFNLTSEQVVGRTDAEVFPPELAVAFRATDESVLGAGCPIESEEEALYDGGPHTYIVHKFPLRDAAGDIYAVGGISTDITARKLEEDELRRQKEVLQKIFDHIPVLINFIGQDGRLKLVNREWERTLGWSLEEIVNQDIDVLREAYPDPQDHKNVLNFIATANAKWGAFRTRVRDGRVIDTAWANIRLSDGTSVGIGQDITEQKRAQDALLESHNLQRAVVDGTPDAVFVKDRQGRYQMINSAGAGFVGKQVEEIIGRDDADLFPPETLKYDQRIARRWANDLEARLILSSEAKTDSKVDRGITLREQLRFAWLHGSITGFINYRSNTPSLESLIIRNPGILPVELRAAFAADPVRFLLTNRDVLPFLLNGVDLPLTRNTETGVRVQSRLSRLNFNGEVVYSSGKFIATEERTLLTSFSAIFSLDMANSVQVNLARGFAFSGTGTHTSLTVGYVHRFGAGSGGGFQFATLLGLNRGHIQGRVFGDLNGNGREDPGENGIAGMTIRMDGKRSVVTDSRGDFTFGSLEPGDIDVALISDDLGVKLRASNATEQHVSLSARHTVNLSFGLTNSGFAAGRVFNDLLLTGEQAAGEAPGLPGVKLILQLAEPLADSKLLIQMVDGNGLYEFRNLAPGKYVLGIDTATIPANFRLPAQTTWPITVSPLQGVYLDFPLGAQRAVSGTVYMDFDGDGKFTLGDDTPIPGAYVRIGQAEAMTDSTGSYILRNIVAGHVEIRAGTTRGYASRSITVELPSSPSILRDVNLAISKSVF